VLMLLQQIEHQATLRAMAMRECERNKGSGTCSIDERQSQVTVTAPSSTASWPRSVARLLSIQSRALENFWRSVLLGMIGHNRNEATRGKHREGMHSHGGLGDQILWLMPKHVRPTAGQNRTKSPCRVFTGA
jgi:hypothetical protein